MAYQSAYTPSELAEMGGDDDYCHLTDDEREYDEEQERRYEGWKDSRED